MKRNLTCIILAIIGGVGVKLAYDYGYKVASEQAEAKVQKLAEAVENKAKINSMIAEIKVPTELNSDTVEEYLAEIAKAIDKIDDGEIKTLLENKDLVITAGTKANINFYDKIAYDNTLVENHAYSLHNKDENGNLILSNPHYSGIDIKVSEPTFVRNFFGYVVGKIPDKSIWENPYNPDDYVYDPDDFNKVWTFYY